MKKVLLLLSLLFSICSYADIARTSFFNFNAPTQLSPSITPSSSSGGVVNINDITFTNNHIQVSFSRVDPTWVIGAQIFTYQNPYTQAFTYYLRLTNGTKMIVKAINGSMLKRITFADQSNAGSLELDNDSPQPGTQSNLNLTWEAGTANVSEVVFRNHGNASTIYAMTVEYLEPSAVLTPVWTNYVNGGTIPAFESFNLRFRSPITLQSSSSIRMSHKGGNLSPVVTTSGDTLKIGLATPITTDDTVKVTIDARAIRTTDLYENTSLSYTIPVHELRSTFVCESVDPAPGRVTEIPNPIKLKFSMPILLDEEQTEVIVFKDDEPFFATHLTKDPVDQKTALISYTGHYTDNGVYRFVIKEGAVHTTFLGTSFEEQFDRWNPADTLAYEISDEPEPEPEPEPQPEDSETMKAAKQLLTVSGVGYPAEDAPARTALRDMTEAEEAPADDDIKAAIQAFYAETKVTLPTKDEWYQIVGVNSENESIYVTLEDEGTRASVSKDKAKAANFQAVAVDDEANTVVFATKDGKYLHVLSALPNYDKTSVSNLTGEQSDVNNLVFDKFTAQSLNNEAITDSIMFGKFTMKGQLGKNQRTGTDDEAYACLNYTTDQGSISTEAHDDNEKYLFADNNSHAFIIKSASEPTAEMINPSAKLIPDTIGNSTETLKLVFENVHKVLLKDGTKPYFKKQGTDSKVEVEMTNVLTAVEECDYEFLVHADGLEKNDYELVIPTGTFDYSTNSQPVNDIILRFTFTIGKTDSHDQQDPYNEKFQYTYGSISWLEDIQRDNARIDYIEDKDLNDFTLFSMLGNPYSGLVADNSKIVKLYMRGSEDSGEHPIAYGHFVPYPEITDIGYPDCQAIKLLFDEPVVEGSLQQNPGIYVYVIDPATYGDLNFGSYLNDSESVDSSLPIIVNDRKFFYVYVDNERAQQRADGIFSVTNNSQLTSVVFDLQGRRHTGALKPGLYIIDGKKRVVK